MRVHIETAMATAEGSFDPGEHDVSDELGRAWCASGAARDVQAKAGAPERQADTSEPTRGKRKGVRWVAGKPREAKA